MAADCYASRAHCDWQAWRGDVIPIEANLEDMCLFLVRVCLSSRTCCIFLGASLTLLSDLRLSVVELTFHKVALDLVGGGLVVLAGVASAVAVVGVVVALVASPGGTGLRVSSSSMTSSSAFAAAAAAPSASLLSPGVTELQAEDDPFGTSGIMSSLLAL